MLVIKKETAYVCGGGEGRKGKLSADIRPVERGEV